MSTRRLFFALWPNARMQGELCVATQAVVEACGGRPIAPESLHITLAFLGSVPEAAVAAVRGSAGRVAAGIRSGAALVIRLDELDYWRKAQILCAVARESSSAPALADALRQALLGAGFTPDLKPFRAHVTLARKVARAPRERNMTAVDWSFSEFALIESRTGPRASVYSTVDAWALCST